MVKRCCYGNCNTYSGYSDRVVKVVFFPFPKPSRNIDKCLRWIKLCGRPHQKLNVDKLSCTSTAQHFFVCSKHFVEGKPTQDSPDPLPVSPFDRQTTMRRTPKHQPHSKSTTSETMRNKSGVKANQAIMEHRVPTHHKNRTRSHIRKEANMLLEKMQGLGLRPVLFLASPLYSWRDQNHWVCEILAPLCHLSENSVESLERMKALFDLVIKGWTPKEMPATAPTRPPPCPPETPAAASTRPPPCLPETPAGASTRPPPCRPETPAAASTRPPPCRPETPAAASTRPSPCTPETPAGASSNGLEQEVLQHTACREEPSPRLVQEEKWTDSKKSTTAPAAGMWTIGELRAVLHHPVTGNNAEMRGYIQQTISEYREGGSLLQGEKSRQCKLLTAAWSPQVRLNRAEVLQHTPSRRPVQEETWTQGTQVKEEEEPLTPGLPVKKEEAEKPRAPGLQLKEGEVEKPRAPGLQVKEEEEAAEPWNPGLQVKEEREELWVSPGGDGGQETKEEDVVQDPSSPGFVKTEDAPPPPTDPTEAGPPTRDSEADIKPEPQPLSFVSDRYETAEPQPLSFVSDHYATAEPQPLSRVSDRYETAEPQPLSCASDRYETAEPQPLSCASDKCTSTETYAKEEAGAERGSGSRAAVGASRPDMDSKMRVRRRAKRPVRELECDTKNRLQIHMRVHVVERPYSCPDCGKAFTTNGGVNKHIWSVHRADRPFCCELCTSSFKFKSGLNRHRRVHTGERPFACSSCGLTYTARDKLTRHIKIHHRITSVKCKMKA